MSVHISQLDAKYIVDRRGRDGQGVRMSCPCPACLESDAPLRPIIPFRNPVDGGAPLQGFAEEALFTRSGRELSRLTLDTPVIVGNGHGSFGVVNGMVEHSPWSQNAPAQFDLETQLGATFVDVTQGGRRRQGLGVAFNCPHCGARLMLPFENPVDGGPPLQAEQYWTLAPERGGDGLTLVEPIDFPGHFSGHVKNGELLIPGV